MRKGLFESLIEYGRSDNYPLHMPGHKRMGLGSFDPYSVDITEIEGFDDLHDAGGLIRDIEDRTAALYGADRSYILVNGVTGGILSALSALTHPGDTVLMARNCHRAAYSGVIASDLEPEYIYPGRTGVLTGGIDPRQVEQALSDDPRIKTVVITSPTYEGFVSDVEEIAHITHAHGGVLIADEAHGAHFRFGKTFPASAVEYADITLHGAHKTLPAFTQSAFLHVRGDRVDRDRLEKYLRLYQTSSPSYILMAGLERCITFLEDEGEERFAGYERLLADVREGLGRLRSFRLADKALIGKAGIFDIDPGKLVIMPSQEYMTGAELSGILREKYHMECEMAAKTHIIAMTSVMDTREGLYRLVDALNEMDKPAEYISERARLDIPEPVIGMKMREAFGRENELVITDSAKGRISSDFIYLYPPGIPLVAPGEIITDEICRIIREYREAGLDVKGVRGVGESLIKVVI